MVKKIDKALARFTQKERDWVRVAIEQLVGGNVKGLDIKKLKGVSGIYRARKGRIRILFEKKDVRIKIISVERRDDDTYKNL